MNAGVDKRLDCEPDPLRMGMNLPPGHLTREDELVLSQFASERQLAVELGTYHGRSAMLLSYFAERVVSIDSFSYVDGPAFDEVAKTLSTRDNIRLIHSRSDVASTIFEDGSIDFLFVDADHTRLGVVRDVQAFWPKLTDDALIVFHDYLLMTGANPMMDVKSPVDDMVAAGALRMVEVAGWCAVCQKGSVCFHA